ncbi:MAG: Holliday junction branch migration protein RuvA [Clostridiales bacterium]|nr:Holliday junction branch migration protein RuvA [Clostridiales bacterium]MCD7828421.1 Holliday junction branch migration protein RuvA [Clostridiales bacterium]
MFYSLTGNVIAKDSLTVAIECGGVGFRCSASVNTLTKIGDIGSRINVYTYLSVKEDSLELYGFYDMNELECFKQLISVTGVGPKAALAILSVLTPDRLAAAVAMDDKGAISQAQGVGTKIAQRVILELKGKLSGIVPGDGNSDGTGRGAGTGNAAEAVSALQFLGYSQYESMQAVKLSDPTLPVEEIIKNALGLLSKNL